MKKLGIGLNNFSDEVGSIFIEHINKFLDENPTYDIIGFYEVPGKPAQPTKFALMDIVEMSSYQAPIIVTNLSLADYLIKTIEPKLKVFYALEYDWVLSKNLSYDWLKNIYKNKDLKIISRFPDIKESIEILWGAKVDICTGLDIQKLIDYVDNKLSLRYREAS